VEACSAAAVSRAEAAAAGGVQRIDALVATAPWTIQSLSADGWTAVHLAAFVGRDAAVIRLLELGADARQWARAFETNLAIPPHARAVVWAGTHSKAGRRDWRRTSRRNTVTRPDGSGREHSDAIDVLLAARRHLRRHRTARQRRTSRAKGHLELVNDSAGGQPTAPFTPANPSGHRRARTLIRDEADAFLQVERHLRSLSTERRQTDVDRVAQMLAVFALPFVLLRNI
jgi:hypothetical protein